MLARDTTRDDLPLFPPRFLFKTVDHMRLGQEAHVPLSAVLVTRDGYGALDKNAPAFPTQPSDTPAILVRAVTTKNHYGYVVLTWPDGEHVVQSTLSYDDLNKCAYNPIVEYRGFNHDQE